MTKNKLPRYKHVHRQLSLPFSALTKSMTYWTCTIGELFEEASATLTRGQRLTADSDAEYSPDVEVQKDQLYLESKACGKSGRVILYSRRAERELEWATANSYGHFYHIWRHKFVTKEYANEQELLLDAPNRIKELCILPASLLFDLARVDPTRVVNRWNPLGYTTGWLVPYSRIRASCINEYKKANLTIQATLPVHLKNLSIFSSQPLTFKTHAIRNLKPVSLDQTDLREKSGRPF